MQRPWFILILLALLSACASKQAAKKQAPNPILMSGSKKPGSPVEVDALKGPAQIIESSETMGKSSKAYFAKIQILSETLRGPGCEESQKKFEEVMTSFMGKVADDGHLSLEANTNVNVHSLLNVELRTIGFDEMRFQASFLNGKPNIETPYNLAFSVRPNNIVQMRYLDKTAELRLDNTPVYTFTATESRGVCEITHNVNLFAEDSGRYLIR